MISDFKKILKNLERLNDHVNNKILSDKTLKQELKKLQDLNSLDKKLKGINK